VQNTGSDIPTSGFDPAAHSVDGASAVPDIIHDQHAPAAEQRVAGELQKGGPGQLVDLRILGEFDRSDEHIADVQRFGHDPARDDAAARDDEDHIEMPGDLGQHVVDQQLDIAPRQFFTFHELVSR